MDLGPAFGEILSKNLIRIRVSKTQIDIKMLKTPKKSPAALCIYIILFT